MMAAFAFYACGALALWWGLHGGWEIGAPFAAGMLVITAIIDRTARPDKRP
jgi:hypothetical protein